MIVERRARHCSCKGRINGWGWGGAPLTVHEGFHFLFCFPKSQPERDERSSAALQQAAMMTVVIYCESHESVAEIKPGEPGGDCSSLSGIECVGELSLRVFTK